MHQIQVTRDAEIRNPAQDNFITGIEKGENVYKVIQNGKHLAEWKKKIAIAGRST